MKTMWLILGIVFTAGLLLVYLLVRKGIDRYHYSRSYDGHVFDGRDRRY